MSNLNHLFDLPEQICYVQCGFCTTILLVSVPCSSLSTAVTVRCGCCTSLLSVNMMKSSFVPLHLLASLSRDGEGKKEASPKDGDGCRRLDRQSPSMLTSSDYEEEDGIHINQIVNKPPEKRQRAPSAYNCFIKEEIRRLKAQNPNMTHKEAFSTAAKNWAQFPPTHYRKDVECGKNQDPSETTWNSDALEGSTAGFRERKAPRNSIWARTPFDQ